MIKRYPCQAAVLLVLGILTAKGLPPGRQQEILLAAPASAAAALLLASWALREKAALKKLRQAMLLGLVFAAGMARMHAAAREAQRQTDGLFDGQAVTVQGRVTDKKLKETSFGTLQWTVCLADSYLKTPQEIRSCGNIILYISQESIEPVIGNTILVSGNVTFFQQARNEGNFDEAAYYRNQGYSIKLYGKEGTYQAAGLHRDRLREFLYSMRQRMMQEFQKSMPPQAAGVLGAMLLGEKSFLSGERKELYRQSGIAHILAISGLHISILGAAAFALMRRAGGSYMLSSAVSMGLLAAFGLMAGMGISTARAVVMFGIFLGAQCCGRAYDSMNALAVAAACILLHNPCALFLAGFQFSFAAVAGVLLGKEACLVFRPRYRLTETVLASLSIQALTLPLTAWYYFEIPVYSVLLNLFVLPFMGLVLGAGLLGGIAGILSCTWMPPGLVLETASRAMLCACAFVLEYFAKAGEFFLKLPKAVQVTGQPEGWQMALYYLLLFGYVWISAKLRENGLWRMHKDAGSRSADGKDSRAAGLRHIRRMQKLAAAASSGICLCILFFRVPGPAEVVALDVGQGDAVYIRTSGGLDVFVDGGSSDVKQAGTYRILPFLKSRGVAEIDCWFVSHLDQDHISGLKEAIDSGYGIGQVVFAKGVVKDEAYEALAGQLAGRGIAAGYLGRGDVLHAGQASFRALAPDGPGTDRNAQSLVLLYEDGGFSGFFSGDISVQEERRLAAQERPGRAVLYKAAHHGSKHSNSMELLECLKPQVCIVSCSADNDYGHPGKEAVEHMESCGSTVCYTMHSGQIRVRQDAGGIRVIPFIP